MRLRILLEPHHGATYAQILALAKAADDGGFDAFFRSDHYLGIDANDLAYQPTDSWTTLAGLAVQTERVRLGTLVNASTFRLPGKQALTEQVFYMMLNNFLLARKSPGPVLPVGADLRVCPGRTRRGEPTRNPTLFRAYKSLRRKRGGYHLADITMQACRKLS